MAESDNDSFVLIEQHAISNNAQLTHSILSNKSRTDSIDQWSEVSVPSVKSMNSIPKRAIANKQSAFSVFTGTYLQSQPPMIPGLNNNNNNNGTSSDKGYYLINSTSQENAAIFSSNSTTNDDNTGNINQINNVNPNSIGSVGSRVPFSWAEITKIQPQFHNENDKEAAKPKVFDSTPKILTRHRAKNNVNNNDNNNNNKLHGKIINDNSTGTDDSNPMPAIPESDPFATKTKSVRVRRSGKRGSRLKYPNGRRGSKKNWRKKYQK